MKISVVFRGNYSGRFVVHGGVRQTYLSSYYFSAIFSEKNILSFVIPPFHLGGITALIINGLYMVELWMELGWNFM